MIDSKVAVYLKRGIVYFNEFSFYEYKNICKMLVSTHCEDINDCLEYIINENIICSKKLDIIDKFKSLITVRNTVLGNEVSFLKGEKQINVNLSNINNLDYINEPINYDILTLSSPVYFYSSSYDDYIAQCLIAVKGEDVRDLSIVQKKTLLGETSLSITDVYKKLFDAFSKRNVEIYKELSINIYSQEYILQFLRNILYEDLFEILNFEYTCIRNLDFKANDFKNYTYPELKIFLNHLTKEKEEEKGAIKDR